MRLPSVTLLVPRVRNALVRFPLSNLCGVAMTAIAMMILQDPDRDPSDHLIVWLMPAALGPAIGIILTLIGERHARTQTQRWLLQAAGLILLLLLGSFVFSGRQTQGEMLRYFSLLLAVNFLAAVAPGVKRGDEAGFWEFNRQKFENAFATAVYCAALSAGMSLAVFAVQSLFGEPFGRTIYGEILVIVWGFGSVLIFTGGIPSAPTSSSWDAPYPQPLRLLAQYILLPLVCIYSLILLVYSARIVIVGSLPKGIVGLLVTLFSVIGILTFLLLRPLTERPEYAWLRRSARGFFALLIPFAALLGVAVGTRIGQYGITPDRYYVALIGTWLVAVGITVTLRGFKNTRFIPISITAILLLSCFGPWSALDVSVRNQSNRVEDVLRRNGMVANGVVTTNAHLSAEDQRILRSGVEYLVRERRTLAIQPWFSTALAAEPGTIYGSIDNVVDRAMLEAAGVMEAADETPLMVTRDGNLGFSIAGFDEAASFVTNGNEWQIGDVRDTCVFSRGVALVRLDTSTNELIVEGIGEPIHLLLDSLQSRVHADSSGLTNAFPTGRNGRIDARVTCQRLTVRREESARRVSDFRGVLMVRWR